MGDGRRLRMVLAHHLLVTRCHLPQPIMVQDNRDRGGPVKELDFRIQPDTLRRRFVDVVNLDYDEFARWCWTGSRPRSGKRPRVWSRPGSGA